MRELAVACGMVGLVSLMGCSTLMNPGDDLSKRVDYLRQDVEDLTKQQKALTEQISQLREQLREGPPSTAETPAPKAEAKVREPSGEQEATNMASDPASRYKRAFDLMEAGKYGQAESAFADFVSQFPQSELADNAQYWIGECLYAENHYEDALTSFKAVSNHFPFGNKVPDALYKQAMCEQKLGKNAEAKKTLEKLRDYYPYSEAASKAKKLLAQP
jgi:tol-pal system protein YbgF